MRSKSRNGREHRQPADQGVVRRCPGVRIRGRTKVIRANLPIVRCQLHDLARRLRADIANVIKIVHRTPKNVCCGGYSSFAQSCGAHTRAASKLLH